MGDSYKENWFDFLPWVLLKKRASFQKELGTSPAMLTYGTNLAIPGDLLRDPGEPLTEPELQELVKYMGKQDNLLPHPTTKVSQQEVPEPPLSVTHVYTRQHKATGLQCPYVGPFPIVDRVSRSQVKIRVGFDVRNQPKYEIRNWRDLKICDPPEGEEASRPKRGRPPKNPQTPATNLTSLPDASVRTEVENSNDSVNKTGNSAKTRSTEIKTNPPNIQIEGGKRPIRSTRNPMPAYIDSVTGPPPNLGFPPRAPDWSPEPWSASPLDLADLNHRINWRASNQA